MPHPLDIAREYRLREATLDRIEAGHDAILAEIQPTKEQLEHGLELHYGSIVADAQGGITPLATAGIRSDRMQTELEQLGKKLELEGIDARERAQRVGEYHRRSRAFESAFDQQWIEESRALNAIVGIDVAEEDVAHPNENTFEDALTHLARSSFAYGHRSDLIRVSGMEDIRRGKSEGRTCMVLHLAGVGCFAETDDPVSNLDLFYALGVRMSQLTYIQDNPLCSSWLQEHDKGLTPLGREVVGRMNELGIMVDIAHCGKQSALDAIDASTEPVLISHTGCAAVYDDSRDTDYVERVLAQDYAKGIAKPSKTGNRNADDDVLRALAKKGGVAAFYTIGYMLGTGPESFHTWAEHVEHAVEVAGIDHVAVGSDRTFFPTWKPSPLDWTNWPYLTVGLLCRGFSSDDVRKIIGGNYLRYAAQVLDKKPWGPLI